MEKILIIVLLLLFQIGYSQEKVNPGIKNFGGIYPIPEAVELPDSSLNYKIVIDLYSADKDPKEMAYSIYNVSRMINLHMQGGVPKEKLKIAGVIHGPATRVVMDNKSYQKKYKTDNPNIEIIKELKEFGVEFFVCGQSLKSRDIAVSEKIDEVKLSISALTVLTTYQLRGYSLLTFD